MFKDRPKKTFHTQKSDESLNGFWGKLARKFIDLAVSAISTVPIIGPTVAAELKDLLKDITNDFSGGFWNKTSDYEPTESEAVILNAWSAKFTTFYKTLATELANSLNQNVIENKVTGINSALSKMCVVKGHYAKYETTGLSSNAVIWRSDLIAELLAPLENLIYLESLNGYSKAITTFSIPTGLTGYTPLFTSTPLTIVACSRFVPNGGNEVLIPIGSGTSAPIFGNPNQPTVLPVGSENTIPNTLPNSGASKTGNFLQKNAIPLAVVVIAAVSLIKGKRKKSK